MQYDHHPSSPPNNLPAPPRSNKKLWVILGSIAGVMVIVMGGCVACGALIGISTLSSADGQAVADSADTSATTSSKSDAATGRGGGLAGVWAGTLQCGSGEALPSVYKVAGSGNPVYEYQTKGGPREVELTSPGQRVRFVPPEGGVVTVVVDALTASPDRISYTLRVTGERASGGTLDQSEASVTTEAELSGEELEVEMTIRSQSVMSQPGIVVPGDESRGVCRGTLRKE